MIEFLSSEAGTNFVINLLCLISGGILLIMGLTVTISLIVCQIDSMR